MPKRIANGLTLLSAVVCVGSAMLVGRSFYRYDVDDSFLLRRDVSVRSLVDGQL